MDTAQETSAATSTASDASKALAQTNPVFGHGAQMFDDIRAHTETMTASIEANLSKASEGVTALNIKAVDALRENVNSTFELWEKLIGARTFAQALELQASHARQRLDVLTEQGQGLSALAQRVAQDSFAPMRGLNWANPAETH